MMSDFCDFIGYFNLVDHNASFDKNFLDAELNLIDRTYPGKICCSMLLARRVLTAAPNHKLSTLVDYLNIQTQGGFHRALFDAEMTAKIWLKMLEIIRLDYELKTIPFALVEKLCRTPTKRVDSLLANWQ